ncbi:MAG: hypothetical protein AUK47_12750 [Deltaproteobacteria bacterium CG2_30_63_29]|nr:MAG: hypothetical protein AUK47_12750 [Deltaproteobacteria bacterium CG2_30_63_29]
MFEALLDLVQTPTLVAGATGLATGATLAYWQLRHRLTRQTFEGREHLLNAVERALRGEPREVFELLKRHAEDPDAPPSLYFAMAAALRRLDMTERSAQIHRALLARKLSRTDRIRAQLGLAVDTLEMGRPSLAEDILRELPRSVRKHPSLLAVRRKTAIEAGDWKEALESTSLMIRNGTGHNKSDIADVYARMGDNALAHDDAKLAARSYRKALRRDESNLRARHGLAEVYRLEGRTSRARKHLMRILEDNVALAPMLLPAIRATLSIGSSRDQEKYFKLLEKLAKDERAALWIGLEQAELLLGSGKTERSKELLLALLVTHPRAFEVHEAYLNFLIETQDDGEVLKHIARFLEIASLEILRFRCGNCGFLSERTFFDCPRCNRFGRLTYITRGHT